MKFKVDKDILLKGIETIQNVISTKATLPILSNFLIETQKDTLKLTATDLNIGITCVIPVEIIEQGCITLPAKRFSSIIRELPDALVEINTKKNNLVLIENKSCQFKIVGLPGEEFPKLPEFKDKEVIKLEQSFLRQMLNQTVFAVSMDETRYILNGILFEITKDKLNFVSTDGKRLAICKNKINQTVTKDIKVIVPVKTIHELLRNLKDDSDPVSLVVGQNQIMFDFGKVIIISRLIEGDFPDYQQVIPPVSENKIKADRAEFLLSVKRAALLSTPDYQAVKFEILKNKLVISKSTPDIGESREEVEVDYSGKEMVVGFNPTFLVDVLKTLTTEKVELEVNGSEKPGVIRNDGYVYIVLPMRPREEGPALGS